MIGVETSPLSTKYSTTSKKWVCLVKKMLRLHDDSNSSSIWDSHSVCINRFLPYSENGRQRHQGRDVHEMLSIGTCQNKIIKFTLQAPTPQIILLCGILCVHMRDIHELVLHCVLFFYYTFYYYILNYKNTVHNFMVEVENSRHSLG